MSLRNALFWAVPVLAATSVACKGSDDDLQVPEAGAFDVSVDVQIDGGFEAGVDALADGSSDASKDVSVEAEPDAGDGAANDGSPDADASLADGGAADAATDADGGWTPVACVAPDAGGATSCAEGGAGLSTCGPTGTDCCCASLGVPGGTFHRTYEAVDADGGALDGGATGLADPATVSAFRLDEYDVTVGRFRRFLSAVSPPDGGPGWVPAPGSGKHTHLYGGLGLVNVAETAPDGGAVHETGWLAADDGQIAPTDTNLTTDCSDPTSATWTAAAGSHETLPMNCVTWWEAYAFCIWDGGFLPSEAEWAFAAAGGSEQRAYPWGSTDPGTASQYAIYDSSYDPGDAGGCTGVGCIAPVGSAPLGAGAWGQLDLAGNVFERLLDSQGTYVTPCVDCVQLGSSTFRMVRGGSFDNPASVLLSSVRNYLVPGYRSHRTGFRCARTP
jgi:formylglycine-generating enzyme required for sulfatase activity